MLPKACYLLQVSRPIVKTPRFFVKEPHFLAQFQEFMLEIGQSFTCFLLAAARETSLPKVAVLFLLPVYYSGWSFLYSTPKAP